LDPIVGRSVSLLSNPFFSDCSISWNDRQAEAHLGYDCVTQKGMWLSKNRAGTLNVPTFKRSNVPTFLHRACPYKDLGTRPATRRYPLLPFLVSPVLAGFFERRVQDGGCQRAWLPAPLNDFVGNLDANTNSLTQLRHLIIVVALIPPPSQLVQMRSQHLMPLAFEVLSEALMIVRTFLRLESQFCLRVVPRPAKGGVICSADGRAICRLLGITRSSQTRKLPG